MNSNNFSGNLSPLEYNDADKEALQKRKQQVQQNSLQSEEDFFPVPSENSPRMQFLLTQQPFSQLPVHVASVRIKNHPGTFKEDGELEIGSDNDIASINSINLQMKNSQEEQIKLKQAILKQRSSKTDKRVGQNDVIQVGYKYIKQKRDQVQKELLQEYNAQTGQYSKQNFQNLQEEHRLMKEAENEANLKEAATTIEDQLNDNKKIHSKKAVKKVSKFGQTLGVTLKLYRFAHKIKQRLMMRNARSLTNTHLQLLNDSAFSSVADTIKAKQSKLERFWSHFYAESNQYKSFWTYLCSKCCYQIDKLPIIAPTNPLNILREFVHIFFIIFTLFYVPIELIEGFTFKDIYGEAWQLAVLINNLFFITDICIKFNTGIYEKGLIITSRKDIAIRYLNDQFIRDIIALFPFVLSSGSYGAVRSLNLLVFIKITTVSRILQNIQDMIASYTPSSTWPHYIQFIKLGMTIAFCGHIVACLFLSIAIAEENYGGLTETWLIAYGVEKSPWYSQYLSALYFAVTTMTTVGYGDIVPKTNYEICFAILNLIVSCGIFAYTFNSVGGIIDAIQKDGKELKRIMSLVNRYLEKKHVEEQTKIQVRQYLKYKFKSQNDLSTQEEQQVLSTLPDHLQQQIVFEANSTVFRKCKNFFGQFSKAAQDRLTVLLKEVRVQKNQVIFDEGDLEEDPILFMIESGEIDIYVEALSKTRNSLVIKTLRDGEYFGDYSFVTGMARTASAKVRDFSILYTLSQHEFINALKEFPQDYEKFILQRDKLLFTGTKYALQAQCYICNDLAHFACECPSIHYTPDKEKVVLRQLLFSLPQIRCAKWPRMPRHTCNALETPYVVLQYPVRYEQFIRTKIPKDYLRTRQQAMEQADLVEQRDEEEEQINEKTKALTRASQANFQLMQVISQAIAEGDAPKMTVSSPKKLNFMPSTYNNLEFPMPEQQTPNNKLLFNRTQKSQHKETINKNLLQPEQNFEAIDQSVNKKNLDRSFYILAEEDKVLQLPTGCVNLPQLDYERQRRSEKSKYSSYQKNNVLKGISRATLKRDYQDYVLERDTNHFFHPHDSEFLNLDIDSYSCDGEEQDQRAPTIEDYREITARQNYNGANKRATDNTESRPIHPSQILNTAKYRNFKIYWPDFNLQNVLSNLHHQQDIKLILQHHQQAQHQTTISEAIANTLNIQQQSSQELNHRFSKAFYMLHMAQKRQCNASHLKNERFRNLAKKGVLSLPRLSQVGQAKNQGQEHEIITGNQQNIQSLYNVRIKDKTNKPLNNLLAAHPIRRYGILQQQSQIPLVGFSQSK